MFQCMESHWDLINKNACQFLSKIQPDTTEPPLITLNWCCLYYSDNSASFHLKIMNSHAFQNSLPQSIGNAHQSLHLMEAQKKSNLSNGSEPFQHKSSLAAACKHHRDLFPSSCNLTPLPAYLWEMSTCSLDVFQCLSMARHPLLSVTHCSPVGSGSWPQIFALLHSPLCLIYACPNSLLWPPNLSPF